MFTIILQNSSGEKLKEIYQDGNDRYLMQEENDYNILSELSECSYDVFSSNDMEGLILELEQVKAKLNHINDISHVEKVIFLAKKCKELETGRLIFTPFKMYGVTH
jgi:hypothetical protein